jgi:hypothetical protein
MGMGTQHEGEIGITRRRFPALTGGTVGVATLACCGLTVLGTRQPAVKFVIGRVTVIHLNRD